MHIPDWRCGRPALLDHGEGQNRTDPYGRWTPPKRRDSLDHLRSSDCGLPCRACPSRFQSHGKATFDGGLGVRLLLQPSSLRCPGPRSFDPGSYRDSAKHQHGQQFPSRSANLALLHEVQRLCEHQDCGRLQVPHRLRRWLALVRERREDRRQQWLPW